MTNPRESGKKSPNGCAQVSVKKNCIFPKFVTENVAKKFAFLRTKKILLYYYNFKKIYISFHLNHIKFNKFIRLLR